MFSYYASWPTSAPHERIEFKAGSIRPGEFIKMSYCLQGADLVNVIEMESKPTSHGGNTEVATPTDRITLKNVAGAEEMNSRDDGHSWFYDGEWLHLKAVGLYDQTEGGTMETFEDGESKMITFKANEHNQCHRIYGCPVLAFTINNAKANGFGIEACSTDPGRSDAEQINVEVEEEDGLDDDDVEGDPIVSLETLQKIMEQATEFPRKRCLFTLLYIL